jgi:hypothetical protein
MASHLHRNNADSDLAQHLYSQNKVPNCAQSSAMFGNMAQIFAFGT